MKRSIIRASLAIIGKMPWQQYLIRWAQLMLRHHATKQSFIRLAFPEIDIFVVKFNFPNVQSNKIIQLEIDIYDIINFPVVSACISMCMSIKVYSEVSDASAALLLTPYQESPKINFRVHIVKIHFTEKYITKFAVLKYITLCYDFYYRVF